MELATSPSPLLQSGGVETQTEFSPLEDYLNKRINKLLDDTAVLRIGYSELSDQVKSLRRENDFLKSQVKRLSLN